MLKTEEEIEALYRSYYNNHHVYPTHISMSQSTYDSISENTDLYGMEVHIEDIPDGRCYVWAQES